MQAPKIAPGVFDVSIHHALRIRNVAAGGVHAPVQSERHQRRQAKTQRVVEQQIREQSMLKFVTVFTTFYVLSVVLFRVTRSPRPALVLLAV